MYTRLALVSLLATALVGGFAVCHNLGGPRARPDPPLVVESPPQELGEVPVGTHEIVFRVHNPGHHPRRVVGMAEFCRAATLCLQSKHNGPVTVPPGDSVTYTCEVALKRPGPFEVPLVLYLEESDGLRETRSMVHGVALPPAGSTRKE